MHFICSRIILMHSCYIGSQFERGEETNIFTCASVPCSETFSSLPGTCVCVNCNAVVNSIPKNNKTKLINTIMTKLNLLQTMGKYRKSSLLVFA